MNWLLVRRSTAKLQGNIVLGLTVKADMSQKYWYLRSINILCARHHSRIIISNIYHTQDAAIHHFHMGHNAPCYPPPPRSPPEFCKTIFSYFS